MSRYIASPKVNGPSLIRSIANNVHSRHPREADPPISVNQYNSQNYQQYLKAQTKDVYLPQNLGKVTYQHQHSSSNRVACLENNTAKNATKIQLTLSDLKSMQVHNKHGVLSFPKTTTNSSGRRTLEHTRRVGASPFRRSEEEEGYDAADA